MRGGRLLAALLLVGGWASSLEASTAYICRDAAGHQSIQDRPCAGSHDGRTVEIESRPDSAPVTPSRSSLPGDRSARRPSQTVQRRWTARDASRCRQYQQGKFQLQSRMRAGYSAKEGERLRAGLDKINRMIDERCRSVPQQFWVQGNASARP